MKTKNPTDTLRVHYKFMLDDDDSGGPQGKDYAIITMTPRKSDLKNRISKEMDLTIYLKPDITPNQGERLASLLNEAVGWVQVLLPRR